MAKGKERVDRVGEYDREVPVSGIERKLLPMR